MKRETMTARRQAVIVETIALEKELDKHWDFELGMTYVDLDETEQERQSWLNEDSEADLDFTGRLDWGQNSDGDDFDELY